MENLSQRDPKWADVKIGKSKTTVGAEGCNITVTCMVLSQLQNRFVSPADAARYWAYDSVGRMNYIKSNYNGMRFVYRHQYNNKEKIIEALTKEDMGVTLCVNNGAHWLYAKELMDNGDYVIVDPWDGKEYEGVPSKYKITGATTFQRTYLPASEFAAEFWAIAKVKGLAENDPMTEMTVSKMLEVFAVMGIMDVPKEQINLQEFLTVLYKAKERL